LCLCFCVFSGVGFVVCSGSSRSGPVSDVAVEVVILIETGVVRVLVVCILVVVAAAAVGLVEVVVVALVVVIVVVVVVVVIIVGVEVVAVKVLVVNSSISRSRNTNLSSSSNSSAGNITMHIYGNKARIRYIYTYMSHPEHQNICAGNYVAGHGFEPLFLPKV
jgi:hypothetical protein